MVLEAASGSNSLALLRSFARASAWSKTWRPTLERGSMPFDEVWESSAMRAYRSRLRRQIAARPTVAHAFSCLLLPMLLASDAGRGGKCRGGQMRLSALLPTLTATGYGFQVGGDAGRAGQKRPSLRSLLPTLRTTRPQYDTRRGRVYPQLGGMAGGPLNPPWLEWFMGFPDGWTESGCSASASSRRARKSSGKSSCKSRGQIETRPAE